MAFVLVTLHLTGPGDYDRFGSSAVSHTELDFSSFNRTWALAGIVLFGGAVYEETLKGLVVAIKEVVAPPAQLASLGWTA